MARRHALALAVAIALAPAARAHDFTCERNLGLAAAAPDGTALLGSDGLPVLLAPPAPVLDVDSYPTLLAVRTRLANVADAPSVATGVEDALADAAGPSGVRYGPAFAPGVAVPVGGAVEQVLVIPVDSYASCVAVGGEPSSADACSADARSEARFLVRFDRGQSECRARLRCVPETSTTPAWIGARQFGWEGQDDVWSIALDRDGWLHVAGQSWDMAAGPPGTPRAMEAAVDPSGAVHATRSSLPDAVDLQGVAADGRGDVVLGGWGATGMFLEKLTPDGAVVWHRVVGGGMLSALAAGPGGTITAAGLEPHAGTGNDATVVRYDAAGNLVWRASVATPRNDDATAVALDPYGNAYLALTEWTPDASNATLTKIDATGSIVWTRTFPSANRVFGRGVAVSGDVIALSGYDFGRNAAWVAAYSGDGQPAWTWWSGGPTQITDTTALASDAADGFWVAEWGFGPPEVTRLRADGTELWTHGYGLASDGIRAIVPDGAGGAFLAGWTSGGLAGPSAGGTDAFVVRVDANGNP